MRIPGRILVVTTVLAVASTACAGTGGETTTTQPDEATTTTEAMTTTTEAMTTTTEPMSTTSAGGAEGASLTIQNFAFTGTETVSAGTAVTVTNQDGVSHTWTSEDDVWDSGSLSNGESFEFTFDQPGEYSFFCKFHPQMTGTISVEG